MRIVFIDSTAIVPSGPGSPAFFSRYAIEHLRAAGHDVAIAPGFHPDICRDADAVVCEWAIDEAHAAAASGLCKRLIVRVRGFDAFGPLGQLAWGNVDALVYESPFLKQLVEERVPGLRGFRSHVMPGGIDLTKARYKERKAGPVVAMVARGVADKGYQLAWEWARSRPDIQLHAAFAHGEPRLLRYLEGSKPANVTMYPMVDTMKWLDEIDANFLLSASHWESFGYTIAEALACGIKPLIHNTPGAHANWPDTKWGTFNDLNALVFHDVANRVWWSDGGYQSKSYRGYVERELDAAKQSQKFADLILSIPERTPQPARKQETFGRLIAAAHHALAANDIERADEIITRFRNDAPAAPGLTDHRVGLALTLASHYYAADDLSLARTWALRSMADEARPDAMCLLGEIALAEDDLEGAERWYSAAHVVDPVPSHYGLPELVRACVERRGEIVKQLNPLWEDNLGRPDRYLIVVAARNAEKYIGRCLESVKTQTHQLRKCIVIDDASTDRTFEAIADAVGSTTLDTKFFVQERGTRQWSLSNIVRAIREHGRDGDVVVILDGDDELKPNALQRLDEAYRMGAWMTYGNFVTTSGKPSWMPPYPLKALREGLVRQYPWQASHPKTFRKELFDKLTDEDFTDGGKWFQTAGDVALMLPLLEMAGERAMYIPETLYVYNDENDENDHKVDPEGQVRVRDLIYAKPKKAKLEKL